MKYTALLYAAMAVGMAAEGQAAPNNFRGFGRNRGFPGIPKGGKGAGGAKGGNGGATASAAPTVCGLPPSVSNVASVTQSGSNGGATASFSSLGNKGAGGKSSITTKGANGGTATSSSTTASTGCAGGANNAAANAPIAGNGLPELPNPQANFNPANNQGTFGPFTPVSKALPQATGGPTTVNAQQAAALQAAADNWSFDTGMVSNFQNTGKGLTGSAFNLAANIAYNAEVDELTHKAILDSIIGLDPDVSIANQTLTNGVFQSVVNNLQIMAFQGKNKQGLIDFINSVRCTQILPSIDTYMAVAARVIGSGATLRTAIRPDACAAIVAAAPQSAFPGNIQVLNVRSNANKVTNGNSFACAGTPTPPLGPNGGNTGNTNTGTGNTGTGNTGGATNGTNTGTGNTGNGGSKNGGGAKTGGGKAAPGGGKAPGGKGGRFFLE